MKKIVALFSALLILLTFVGCASGDYKEATSALEAGDYSTARAAFEKLADYKDSADKLKECDYQLATSFFREKDFVNASAIFTQLGDYKDSKDQASESDYRQARNLYDIGDFDGAVTLFTKLGEYDDAATWLDKATDAALKKKIIGKWSSNDIDFSGQLKEAIKDSLSDADDFMKYLGKLQFSLSLNVEFTDKDTVIESLNTSSLKSALNKLKSKVVSAYVSYFEDALKKESAAQGITVNDVYANYGVSNAKELLNVINGLDIDEYFGTVFSELSKTVSAYFENGTYTVESGIVSVHVGKSTEEVKYDEKNDELTFTGVGVNVTEKSLYPIHFHRAS